MPIKAIAWLRGLWTPFHFFWVVSIKPAAWVWGVSGTFFSIFRKRDTYQANCLLWSLWTPFQNFPKKGYISSQLPGYGVSGLLVRTFLRRGTYQAKLGLWTPIRLFLKEIPISQVTEFLDPCWILLKTIMPINPTECLRGLWTPSQFFF